MTGRTAHRAGLWHVVMGRTMLHPEEVTIAEVFRAGGYRTAMFGKWYLGDNFPMRPQDQGFEEVWTFGGGVVGHTPDYWMNDYFDDRYLHNGEWEQVEGYCTDVWVDKAIASFRADSSKPAFVYLPLNAPHSPFEVPERFEAIYRDREDVPDPAFYGMITAIEEAMGRLEKALVDSGMRENTILIFLTDNGTSRGVVYPAGKGRTRPRSPATTGITRAGSSGTCPGRTRISWRVPCRTARGGWRSRRRGGMPFGCGGGRRSRD